VIVSMIFLTSMAILLLIFVPKIWFVQMYSEERSEEHSIHSPRFSQRGSVPSAAFYERPGSSENYNKASRNSLALSFQSSRTPVFGAASIDERDFHDKATNDNVEMSSSSFVEFSEAMASEEKTSRPMFSSEHAGTEGDLDNVAEEDNEQCSSLKH
jgi:hypothetical protein